MRDARKWAGILAGVLVLSLVAAACSNDDGDSSGDSGSTGTTGATGGLTGSITVSGSSTVLPISNLVAELFAGQNPDVQVSVDGPGTGDGFVLFCKGETDISDASRPIEDDEKAACSDAGIDYVELAVAFDGITVMTNPQNSAVTCLNSGDLYALFGPQSEGIDTWNGADSLAKKVGGNGGFPDAPLEITAPGAESGTYDAFIELSGIERHRDSSKAVSEDEAATLRPDYQSSPDDNVIIQAMEGSAERARVRRLRVRRGCRGPDQGSSRSTRAAAASSRPGTRSRTVRTRCRGRSTSTSTRRRSRATRR